MATLRETWQPAQAICKAVWSLALSAASNWQLQMVRCVMSPCGALLLRYLCLMKAKTGKLLTDFLLACIGGDCPASLEMSCFKQSNH